MGTRSTIARMNKDGSYDSIYCHWDGYPSNNGKLLIQFYNNPVRVNRLITLGNLSSLREKLNPPKGMSHSFEKPLNDVCVAYGRDRKERDVASKHFAG